MAKAYHHLTRDQRCQIYALNKRGFSQEEIGLDVGVDQCTISRELSRNKGLRGYRPKQAQVLAARRCSAGNAVATVMTPALIERADTLLVSQQWSPQQISGALKLADGTRVSHESLYQHIWADKREGGVLYTHLRQQGKKRNKRSGKNAGRGMIPGRVDISERPKIVDDKTRLGDWELDSIIGAKHVGAITSMVERKTKLTRLVLLPGPTADATRQGIVKRLKPLKAHVLTLTSDNGKEFAGHQKISKNLNAEFYFATPPAFAGAGSITPGSAASTKIPTAWSDSTSPKAWTSLLSPMPTCSAWKISSTTDHAKRSDIVHQTRSSLNSQPILIMHFRFESAFHNR